MRRKRVSDARYGRFHPIAANMPDGAGSGRNIEEPRKLTTEHPSFTHPTIGSKFNVQRWMPALHSLGDEGFDACSRDSGVGCSVFGVSQVFHILAQAAAKAVPSNALGVTRGKFRLCKLFRAYQNSR